ncbi:MAG TPA: YihY/virulence factor BrkB family protein [Ginsengibacter sp.]|nr:YihY/virulence factor BrkB family protein [Ginsengibacter sp.]
MIKIIRIFTEFHPVNYLIRKSKKWVPPGFQGFSLYQVLKYYGRNFSVPHLTERAAAISYNFIMSVPPTCLFLFTLIPNLPFVSKIQLKRQLHALITDIIPAKANNQGIIQFVDSFINGSKIGLISFTIILSLFFASNAVIGLMRSFNKDYIGFKKVKGLKKRWEAIKLTLLLFGLLLACFILLLLQTNILDLIGIKSREVRHLIIYGRWIVIVGLIFYSYAFIYKYAPSTTKRWKLVSPGAIIATSLSIIATIGFTVFVDNFGKYNILYGSIGTIMIIMVMIFLNSLVVLIGFEFNLSINSLKTLSEEKEKKEKTSKS